MAGDSIASGRETKGTETRQRIVQAVWNVIAERGLASLTTRLVARDAGISHGMCHYYFENKDELILAVVEYARHYWIHPMERLVEGPGTPAEKLEKVIAWMAEPATREVMRVHLQLVSHSEWNDRLRERMAAEYARWQAAYVKLFGELQAAGVLRPDLDHEGTGTAFATLADGLVDQQSLNPAVDSEGVMRAFLVPLMSAPTAT
ncbi:MAG: TetR/AcrR family transcriptional regulator [Actinobacteria bacterium]|nr:TetR/AcrR family transcriptional regulator [Actinomycetota bacterium]